MALKDLAADLENFKYGQSSPDKVDSQIKNGVDFFDNEKGGATGFTPKAGDLESQYKKFVEGTVGNKWPEAARSNEKTRTAYGTQGEYSEANIPFNNGLADPPHIFGTDTFGTPWSLDFPQFQSPFMDTPIADFVSQYSITDPSNSLTHIVDPHIFSNEIRIANAHNPTDSLSRIGTYLPLYNNIQYPQNIPTPYTSSPNLSDFSGPVDGRLTTKIPINPRDSEGNNIGRLSQLNYPYPTSDNQNNHDWAIYDGYSSIFDYTEFRSRARSHEAVPYSVPFANSPLMGYHSQNTSDTLQSQYGGPHNINTQRDLWKDGSIHIMNDDTQSPIGGGVSKFANLNPMYRGSSDFSVVYGQFAGLELVYTTPEGFTGTQTTLNLQRENFRTTGGVTIDTLQSEFSSNTMKQNYEDFSYDNLFQFKNGQYKNVPSGITENNKFGTKTYREVADPNNFDLFAQPFILREVGNNWGLNPINSDTGFFGQLAAGADDILGGFFRGAPSFTGLVERNFADKIRIGKFLLTTDGIGFLGKQLALQALNPTLESKIYNPLSTLGIPAGAINDPEGVIQSGGVQGLATLLGALALPISHTERHVGGGRYEDVVPLGKELPEFMINSLPPGMDTVLKPIDFSKENTGFGSRIAMQSNPEVIKKQTIDFGFGVTAEIGGKDLRTSMMLMNPNKYLFPISTAPKLIEKGIPSFIGTVDVLRSDAGKIEDKKGGTFNKKTSNQRKEDDGLVKRHSTLAYSRLNKDNAYGTNVLVSAGENNEIRRAVAGENLVDIQADAVEVRLDNRLEGKKINDSIGSNSEFMVTNQMPDIGLFKGNIDSSNVDKINMIPAIKGTGQTNEDGTAKLPDIITNNPDFIKFMFKDVTNDKYLVFRAILDGISDSVTPEYSDVKFIGRPDKAYIYTGVDRSINFNFKVYPKTKQELPVLMEKLNYLVGMCYPSFTEGERMITPFMELTLGDMFNNTPGLLETLSLTVEDATTWEIEEGLQYPHFISVNCVFKHIGKYVPTANGKHYDLNWLDIGTKTNEDIPSNNNEIRTKYKYINAIGATSAE